jgi:hypothetical protein
MYMGVILREPAQGVTAPQDVPEYCWCIRNFIEWDIRYSFAAPGEDRSHEEHMFGRALELCNSRPHPSREDFSRSYELMWPYKMRIARAAVEKARERNPALVRRDPQPPGIKPGGRPGRLTVREVQVMLKILDIWAGPEDGRFGKNTSAAVASFQEDAGMPVTGVIDVATLSVMRVCVFRLSMMPRSDY